MSDYLVPRPDLVPPRPGRTEGPRPLVPSYRDEDEGRTPGDLSTPTLRDELDARLRAAVAETLRRRAARRQQREEHQAARDVGLAHRNSVRLTRARTRGEAMPETPDTAGDVLTVDVADLRPADLADLTSALARVAGWSTLSVGAAIAVGQLAQQARHALDRRRGGTPKKGDHRPARTPGAPPSDSVRFPQPPDGPEAA